MVVAMASHAPQLTVADRGVTCRTSAKLLRPSQQVRRMTQLPRATRAMRPPAGEEPEPVPGPGLASEVGLGGADT
jgi:hypothetical protein